MLILFAPVLLLGTALSLGVLRVLRPRFRFMWLASFGVAWVAWISVLLWQLQLPMSLALPGWGSTVAVSNRPRPVCKYTVLGVPPSVLSACWPQAL